MGVLDEASWARERGRARVPPLAKRDDSAVASGVECARFYTPSPQPPDVALAMHADTRPWWFLMARECIEFSVNCGALLFKNGSEVPLRCARVRRARGEVPRSRDRQGMKQYSASFLN